MREIFGIAVVIGSLSVMAFAHAGQPTPFIYDSTGKLVGPVVKPGEVVLPLKDSADSVAIAIAVSGIGSTIDAIYYTATICTGALLDHGDMTLVARAYLQPDNLDNILYPDLSAPTTPFFSYFDVASKSCYNSSGAYSGHPLKRASLRAQGFTAPFTVKLR